MTTFTIPNVPAAAVKALEHQLGAEGFSETPQGSSIDVQGHGCEVIVTYAGEELTFSIQKHPPFLEGQVISKIRAAVEAAIASANSTHS